MTLSEAFIPCEMEVREFPNARDTSSMPDKVLTVDQGRHKHSYAATACSNRRRAQYFCRQTLLPKAPGGTTTIHQGIRGRSNDTSLAHANDMPLRRISLHVEEGIQLFPDCLQVRELLASKSKINRNVGHIRLLPRS